SDTVEVPDETIPALLTPSHPDDPLCVAHTAFINALLADNGPAMADMLGITYRPSEKLKEANRELKTIGPGKPGNASLQHHSRTAQNSTGHHLASQNARSTGFPKSKVTVDVNWGRHYQAATYGYSYGRMQQKEASCIKGIPPAFQEA